MIGKNFYWDGQSIMHQTADFRIALSDVQWRKLKVSDDKQDIIGYHGTLTGPTFARGRSIVLEGLIIATTRAQTSMGMDRLDIMFALQGIPSTVEEKEFKIIDEQDRERSIKCKVDLPVDYEIEDDNDHNDGALRRWRVTLFAQDPKFYSLIASVFEGIEGNYGGFQFPTAMSSQRNMSYNEINCITTSNADEPVKISINVVTSIFTPLTIYNVTANKWFMLNIDAVEGDVIIIDAKNQTATKNGINILGTRVPGSQRPTVKGMTKYVIYDVSGGIYNTDFQVTVSFNNSLL
ncbi:hypothetical protein P148_SR1C00001G0876 [candidate division SR1 bacterium RAAC1_SR1_1]|nr:hypothetical protein P148_SR1C00001G0876 [candidate division SR1 bacterium RAAC1_SR1_1]